MQTKEISIPEKKRIVLVAHDNKKKDLLEWAKYNKGSLSGHIPYATGTTGKLLQKELELEINRFLIGLTDFASSQG